MLAAALAAAAVLLLPAECWLQQRQQTGALVQPLEPPLPLAAAADASPACQPPAVAAVAQTAHALAGWHGWAPAAAVAATVALPVSYGLQVGGELQLQGYQAGAVAHLQLALLAQLPHKKQQLLRLV